MKSDKVSKSMGGCRYFLYIVEYCFVGDDDSVSRKKYFEK